jgi:hypothetical protein
MYIILGIIRNKNRYHNDPRQNGRRGGIRGERVDRKKSGRVRRASEEKMGVEGRKGSGSINYKTITESRLCSRVHVRTGALSWFNPSGQPSICNQWKWKQTPYKDV